MRGHHVLIWGLIVFFVGLGGYTIYIVDEARNAQAAWEMYAADAWVVPTFNGVLRTDKPPLHYFAMRLPYSLLGKTAFAARAVSALLGLLLVGVLYRVAARHWGMPSAGWAAAGLLCSLYFPLQMRLATPDPYLIFFFTLSMLGFFKLWQQPRAGFWWILGTYMALGLAALAKGPVAVGLAGLSILVFLIWERSLTVAALGRFRIFWGASIAMAVVLPWLWAVHVATDGAWTQGFFFEHNLQRFSSVKEGHGGGAWVIPVMAVVSLLPFSLLLPLARAADYSRTAGSASFARFCWSVVGVVVVFFMFSRTKLPSYPAPAYPFVALLLSPILSGAASGRRRVPYIVATAWVLVACAIPVAAYFGLEALNLPVPGWEAVGLVPVPLVVLVGVVWYYRDRYAVGLWTVAVGYGLLLPLVFGWYFPRIDAHNHVRQSQPLLANREVVVYARCSPAYIFYAPAPLPIYSDTASLRHYLENPPRQGCPIVLSTHQSDADLAAVDGLQEIFRQKDLFENLTTVLYRYEKQPCH